MPGIKDFFYRIMNSLTKRKDVPKLESAKIKIDDNLMANLNENNINYFEDPQHFNPYCRKYFSIPGNFENQYNYAELITMMQENGGMDDYRFYLDYVKNNPDLYFPSEVHGVNHTSRVILFAEMLCMLDSNTISAHEKNLIMVAAQLHDIGRGNDRKDSDHGRISKIKIEENGLLRNFSERDQDIIKFAVEGHSFEPEQINEKLKNIPRKDRKDYKKILDYLQDADKLDRARIGNPGWGLDPNRLATDTAKKLIKVAHQNYFEYHNMMNYQDELSNKKVFENKLIEYLNVVRQKGFNITLEAFSNIVSEFKPGTLELLYDSGKIEDIFSYEAFMKYRKDQTFDESLKVSSVNPKTLFEEVTKRQQTQLMKEAFDRNYMLYYNLKKNNPDAFELLCYVDLDLNDSILAGLAEKIELTDLEKLNSNGHFFRMNDLFKFASKLTPEEYEDIVQNGKIERLYSSRHCKNQEEIDYLKNNLHQKGIDIDEQTFHSYFRLIQEIEGENAGILNIPEIKQYSLLEVYSAVSKLRDAKYRIRDGIFNEFEYDSQSVISLLEYTRKISHVDQQVSEEEQLDIAEALAIDSKAVKDPRFFEYINKKNKPYKTKNPVEILNYKEFCADKILLNPEISLEKAKKNLIHALFSIDVPSEYVQKFEEEIVNMLHCHQKYLPNSFLETEHKNAMDVMRALFSSTNIRDFKNLLYENKSFINSYNTEQMGYNIKDSVTQYSRKDMVHELQKSASQIKQIPTTMIQDSKGNLVPIKILNGQKFCMATSTAMPECSSRTRKIRNGKNKEEVKKRIYDIMLNTQILPNEICTSLTNDEMLAHAASALNDEELVFGYVPQNANDISVSAMYDLSTIKNAFGKRITREPTTPRSISDFIAGTKEEHNEVVVNNTYPRYIVCYDQITNIAIEKRELLEQEYREKGINQPIEILFIDAKGTYIPRIKSNIEQEHQDIHMKLNSGTFSLEDFSNMFEKRESSFIIRTLQAIHSTSYRDDVWNPSYNKSLIDSMTDILEKVAEIVPPDKLRTLYNQVNMVQERSSLYGYGRRYYDHCYSNDFDRNRLMEMTNNLDKRAYAYESGKTLPNQRGLLNKNDVERA